MAPLTYEEGVEYAQILTDMRTILDRAIVDIEVWQQLRPEYMALQDRLDVLTAKIEA